MEFPIEFTKCPRCGSKDTLYKQALEGELSPPKKPLAYLETKITPIQDFLTLSTPSTKILMRHYDTCAACGLDYCVMAEKLLMLTDLLIQLMGVAAKMPTRK